MASSEAQAELINSLSQDEIPAKLRCAICSKLAVDAFRLPCCEQAICASCQSTLPSSCPVCEHSPLSADDCKPHKALRTTIKVFLRTAEKKREPQKAKDASPAPTPTDASGPQHFPTIAAAGPDPNPESQVAEAGRSSEFANGEDETKFAEQERSGGDEMPSNTELADDDAEVTAGGATGQELALRNDDDQVAKGDVPEGADENVQNDENPDGNPQDAAAGGEFGFGNMFPNMNFGAGGFDQMQMMMAMQNGMAPNNFGNFQMIGMPGMNMDPMTMQMYMNGGFQGMGMNGMNMMGMGGFGGEANNNWNGQQSWNVGQDNFNHPNASGMGNGGDFGSFNTGFQTGYNQQGNYGHQNQYNDYGRPYGFRGRGRGRGGYGFGRGRGGYNQGYGNYGNYQDQNYINQQQISPSTGNQPQGSQGEEQPTVSGNVDEFGRQLRPDEGNDNPPDEPKEGADGDQSKDEEGQPPVGLPIQSLDSQRETSVVVSAHGAQSQAHSGAPPAPDVPINAPKGPKAMLQGLPNTSYRHLQARGWVDGDRTNTPSSTNGKGPFSPTVERPRSRSSSPKKQESQQDQEDSVVRQDKDPEEDELGQEDSRREASHSRSLSRGHSPSPSPSPNPQPVPSHSRSRSRSRDRKESHRRRRNRSGSATDRERDDDRRHRRHRRKHSYAEEDAPKSRDRSRSVSPTDSKRGSHRSSRKERDAEKRRGRDDDYDRRHKSSHRSHRSRERDRRSRDDDRDREKEKERKERDRHGHGHRDRDRDRGRNRDRDHRHRSKKSEPPTPIDDSKEFNPPTGPRGSTSSGRGPDTKGSGGLKSRESAAGMTAPSTSRRSSQASTRVPSSSTAQSDPHAAERAARDRERLLSETRKLAAFGVKRGRDDGEEARRARRKGHRGQVVSVGDEEERMRRMEREREAARYD